MERQYIGARYVPKFFENPNTGDTSWLSGVAYEALTMVTYAGNTYTSKKNVPSGIGAPNANSEYWVATGMYNAYIEELRQDLSGVSEEVTTVQEDLATAQEDITTVQAEVDKISRLKGKRIAIYADSWGNPDYGSLGKETIEGYTGVSVHISYMGSQSMQGIYDNCWDQYNADIYIIEGGLNDMTLGTGGQAFTTAVIAWCNAIRAVNSSAEIYFVTPFPIRTNNQYLNHFPLEFYRVGLWRLSAIHGFACINSLKWQKVKLSSDKVHPLASSAPAIGEYIVNAVSNFGDEATYTSEISTLGRNDTKLLLTVKNGELYLTFQGLTITATTANYGELSFPTGLNTTFGASSMGIINESTGVGGEISITSSNKIRAYQYGLASGSNFNTPTPVYLLTTIPQWDMPLTFT